MNNINVLPRYVDKLSHEHSLLDTSQVVLDPPHRGHHMPGNEAQFCLKKMHTHHSK